MARTWRKIGATSSNKSNNVCVDGSQIVADNVTINGDGYMSETALSADTVKRYLSTKGCTLWMNWDITNDDGLDAASEWLINEIYNVLMFSAYNDNEMDNTNNA